MQIVVSVVMAVHNGLKFLPEAVRSILNQHYADLEFVIIDDGSTDGSGEWLEAAAEKDNRIHLIRQENTGLTKSLNRGLEVAKGEYIARMDADDVAMPERLGRQLEAFRENPDLVLLGTEVELISEDGIRLGARGHPQSHEQIRRELLRGNGGALTHPAVMFPRKLAMELGGYDEAFTTTQDLDLFLRLSEHGQAQNLQESLLHWRQHPESVNRTRSDTWKQMKEIAVEKTIHRLGIERYVEELFAGQVKFQFPSDTVTLGKMAFRRGRVRESFGILYRELKSGERKWAAFEEIVEVSLLLCWWKLRRALRFLGRKG